MYRKDLKKVGSWLHGEFNPDPTKEEKRKGENGLFFEKKQKQ
jgi:hypothetical protein